jgi:SAM-dependent methyltransferase
MATKAPTTVLNKWYQTPLGCALLKAELGGLADVLPQMFGYYIAQIGGPTNNNEILATSPIHNHILINSNIVPTNKSLLIQCHLDELPFLPESIDVFVLFHTLEFANNPKAILNEIYTSLIPYGYVVIFGFNPYSLWGLAYSWETPKEAPWSGNWISPGHIRQWLSKTGFSIGDYKTFYFRPPGNKPNKLLFMEGIGQFFWPYCGASYMYVAQKIITTLTPIRPHLSLAKYFKDAKAVPKPTRTIQCNNKL